MLDPKVSVIFVNYKTPQMTADAINSVKEKTKAVTYEIIVVDNSSDINEYNELVKCINDNNVLIIDAKENLGFGKANNLGSTYAKGKYLFFLNTDTLLINDAISILANYLDNNSNVGIVGGNLYTKDLKPNHSFMKKEKNIKHDIYNESLRESLIKRIIRKRCDFNYTDIPLKIKGYICGADLMIHKDVFDQLEGFEKDIFMYAEESLLCFRTIHELNLEIYNIPKAKIVHLEGSSLSKVSTTKARLMIDGNFLYYVKTFSKEEALNYLNKVQKFYIRKRSVAKLFNKNRLVNELSAFIVAIEDKLKEIGEQK